MAIRRMSDARDAETIYRMLKAIDTDRYVTNAQIIQILAESRHRVRRLLAEMKNAGLILALDGAHVAPTDRCAEDGSQWWGQCRLVTAKGATILQGRPTSK
jgi:hypothetical protein